MPTRVFFGALAIAGVLAVSGRPVVADTVTFTDGDFDPLHWSATQSGSGSSVSTTQPSGGHPDAYRSIALTVAPFENVAAYQFSDLISFTPATEGSVTGLTISYDLARIASTNPGATQIAIGYAVRQDGTIYGVLDDTNGSPRPGVWDQTSWLHVSEADLVSRFPLVNWASGDRIDIGFFDSVGTSEVPFTITGGYDNFRADVTFSPVPEPATALLLAAAGLSLAVQRRRRAGR